MPDDSSLPSVAAEVAPLLARFEPAERPLLLAAAERLAARRYLAWAEGAGDRTLARRMRECARCEDEIADRVEALYEDARAEQARLLARVPELDELGASLFDGRPLREQFVIQAAAERAGAATWRDFAECAAPPMRTELLACAELEERSARVLEALVAACDASADGDAPR